jgi:hypothetical protein
VGLIDLTEGVDQGKKVWGAKILGGVQDIPDVAKQHGVTDVILCESDQPTAELSRICAASGLKLHTFGLRRFGPNETTFSSQYPAAISRFYALRPSKSKDSNTALA